MKKLLAVVGGAGVLVGAPLVLGLAVIAVTLGGVNGDPGPGELRTTASTASAEISPEMLALYQQAAVVCPGLDWRVLAAIGTVESGNGTSALRGVRSGRNPAGAEGPMQFEPATFGAYATPVPPGGADPPSPYDPTDSVYAAARMLCTDGAADPSRLGGAVFAYNHSNVYVSTVLAIARSMGPSATTASTSAGAVAAGFALAQVGTPYRWGAGQPGYGFDCSGLAQAAWGAAGVRLPRVAQAQRDSGAVVAAGTALQPGDLVFFGQSVDSVTHVGIFISDEVMVDAPHSGGAVRIESFPASMGDRWGSDEYLGAARPRA
ncbi:MAG TPA: NlpC/P60 family protein [Acidimicrobiales bacterium]|nr:NlpC/P60 family protein [Acidimicrobiales bacterium]